MSHQWFRDANPDNSLIESIFTLIKLPTEDLKLTGLTLAIAISNQEWGLNLIGENTALIDFLMVRDDGWKSCVDLKFKLITNLNEVIDRNTDTVLCNRDSCQKIQQYVKEGMYYAPFHAEMMVDTDI